MSASNKCITEGKSKVKKTGPRVKQASHPSGGIRALAFVNVDNPDQIKDQATQRKIRRHVMTTIGQSRRKYPTRPIEQGKDVAAATAKGSQQILGPLLHPTPSYWGEVNICPNFKRLFQAMDMVSKGLLSMTVDDTTRKSGERVYKGFHDVQRGNEQDPAGFSYKIRQYTDSLILVRKSIDVMEGPASRHAIIGTVICLAYFDVRNHIRNLVLQNPSCTDCHSCGSVIMTSGHCT